MANNRINKYIGALAFGTVLLAFPGCTDTWDDHYNNSGSAVDATQTLWEQIISNPDYSRFADIARNAKYYKDQEHPVEGYTIADLLSSGQVNTLWLPDNSAITEAEYEKWMAMAQNPASGYEVQQQFFGNHIALWRRNISEPGVDTVKMINGKHLVFDKGNRTLEGIALKEINLASTNGVMHVLGGVAPFHYNFYEHLKNGIVESGFQLDSLRKYVLDRDTTYFDQNSSIEGITDAMGRPTYVDSVYYTSNRLFYQRDYLPVQNPDKWPMSEAGFAANINHEDSMFIMLMPTNDAWKAAYSKLAPSHIYATQYDDKSTGNIGTAGTVDLSKDVPGRGVSEWTDMSIKMDVVSTLVFNVHKQPKLVSGGPLWTLDEFINDKGSSMEYLLNTYGDTIRNAASWNKENLFNGKLIKMSNGYGYEISSWDYPWQFVKPDVCVETDGDGVFYQANLETSTKFKAQKGHAVDFPNYRLKEITDIYGEISNNKFYHLEAVSTGAPTADVKLVGNDATAYVPNANVMSGEYEVQLVMVPKWYKEISGGLPNRYYEQDTILFNSNGIAVNYAHDEDGNIIYDEKGKAVIINPSIFLKDKTRDTELGAGEEGDDENEPEDEYETRIITTDRINHEYIKELAAKNKTKIKATLNYNGGTSKTDKTNKFTTVEYSGEKVDTITVGTFNFPVSYKNIRYSYPTLTLTSDLKSADLKNGYIYDFCIDKVILKSKEVKESEGTTTE